MGLFLFKKVQRFRVQRFTRTPEAHKPMAAPEATKVQGSGALAFNPER